MKQKAERRRQFLREQEQRVKNQKAQALQKQSPLERAATNWMKPAKEQAPDGTGQ